MPLEVIERQKITFGYAYDLISELLRQRDSHLFASVQGWQWAMGWGEIAQVGLLHAVRSAIGAEGEGLPLPWDDVQVEQVTPEELEELRAQLQRRSAFQD
jgi:hypothetical protein